MVIARLQLRRTAGDVGLSRLLNYRKSGSEDRSRRAPIVRASWPDLPARPRRWLSAGLSEERQPWETAVFTAFRGEYFIGSILGNYASSPAALFASRGRGGGAPGVEGVEGVLAAWRLIQDFAAHKNFNTSAQVI